jgi:hypothetical protein
MTMEPQDSQPAPKPQVIDLEAEEIGPAPEPKPAPPPPPPPQPKRRGHLGLIAAVVIGLAAGLLLYRGVLSNYLPSSQMTALKNQVAALETNTADLNAQLAGVRDEAKAAATAATAAKTTAGDAGQAAADAAQQAQGVSQALGDSGTRLTALETAVAALSADLDALRTSMPATGGLSVTGTDGAAVTALSQRIAALEKDVASLKKSGGGSSQAQALSQALADLKAKVAAGAPYAAELDRIARMVPAASGLDDVAATAAEGLPDARGLAAELRAAIPSLPRPAAAPPADDGYLGALMDQLSNVITIRPIGETDWPRLAENAAGFADTGDLTQAIAVIDAGEGGKPVELTQWRDRAAARLRLDAGLGQLSDAVLRQITAMGGATP